MLALLGMSAAYATNRRIALCCCPCNSSCCYLHKERIVEKMLKKLHQTKDSSDDVGRKGSKIASC